MGLLTPSQIQTFHGDGYLHLPALFSAVEVDELVAAFDSLHEVAGEVLAQYLAAAPEPKPSFSVTDHGARFTYEVASNGDGFFVRHVAMCGNVAPLLANLGRDPRLLAIAAELLDSREMEQLINQAHYKQPGSTVAFDWHQDSTHRGMGNGGFTDLNGRGSYVQIAIALDQVTPENGPLSFIPGSHRLGHLGLDDANRDRILREQIDLTAAVTPLLAAGDAVAFGPYTLHGSQANRSRHWRRTFINGFAYPGANHRDYGLPDVCRRLHA